MPRSPRKPRSTHIGHSWAPRPGVCPSLLHVSEVRGPHPRKLARIAMPDWVLDYEFGSYGLNRVGVVGAPWVERGPGTVHLYAPGLEFWEDTRRERGARHSAWIFFRGGAEAGLEGLLHPAHRFARFEDAGGDIGDAFARIARVGRTQGEAGYWRAQAIFLEAVGLLHGAARGAVSPRETLAVRFERAVSSRLAEPLTVADAARALHMSGSSLAHRLRAEAGETPRRMLARLRVAQAKALILRGLPLKAIAESLGFCDAFHLSKAFKRSTGESPSAFRKRSGG